MVFNVLSLAPLGAELVKALIQQTPDLPDFEVISGHEMDNNELKQAIKDADIVLGDYTFHQAITEEILSGAHRLKFIQQPSVGYQHIDVEACTKKGIFVANTAGANTVSVAEHTVACGLCLMKNLLFAHKSVKDGRWEQMNIKPAEIFGKIWGIVGFGRIGRCVAERLKPFGLSRIFYFDIQRADGNQEHKLGVEFCEFGELLRQADIVSLHAPLNDSTRMLIDKDALSVMKRTAYLINVARAELVDEKALSRALKGGKIAGAAIDVFSTEPISPDNRLLGVESDKLLFSPHVAGVSDEAAGRIINMAASNIARFIKGLLPESLLNNI
jgi:phosphoglycerate dehydrogenase-like enzyme